MGFALTYAAVPGPGGKKQRADIGMEFGMIEAQGYAKACVGISVVMV